MITSKIKTIIFVDVAYNQTKLIQVHQMFNKSQKQMQNAKQILLYLLTHLTQVYYINIIMYRQIYANKVITKIVIRVMLKKP